MFLCRMYNLDTEDIPEMLNITEREFYDILIGRTGITTELNERLSELFNTLPMFWLVLDKVWHK